MEFIGGLARLKAQHRGCVATIGAFDGVHLGHQAVLSHLLRIGAERSLPSLVITLEPLPREFFKSHEAPPRITTLREKCHVLASLGLERLLCVRFNAAVSRIEAGDFIERVFVGQLGVRHMVVGDDLRFGHEQAGDIDLLRRYARRHNFTVSSTDTVPCDGARISSTRLREALKAQDFVLAERLMGRPYSMRGRVIYGRRLGTQLGVPTANLSLHRRRAAMAGVYAVEVGGLNGTERLPGVANVGLRPTLGDREDPVLEVHVLDYSALFYGKEIEVVFRHRLRSERHFPSLEGLSEQIHTDIASCRAYFGRSKS